MKYPLLRSVLVVALFSCCCRCANADDFASSNPSETVATSPPDEVAANSSQFMIPGPLRSFLRLAGISQKIGPEEVLPLLGRNVFMQGYDGSRKTEFLILLGRYVVQARELSALAGANDGKIRVSNCDDAKPLLSILGYRTRPNCGEPGTSLQTADSERAFLTIDSGFPLPELEQTLQGGKPFEYSYADSPVPLLFSASDWTTTRAKNTKDTRDLVDTLLNDPPVARLYWAFSKLDPETAEALQRSIGIRKLLPYAAVLDFYGSHVCIRAGRVVVPGGPEEEPNRCVEGSGRSQPRIPCSVRPETVGCRQGLAGGPTLMSFPG